MKESFFVYLLRCSDNAIYCGYTSNPLKRIEMHNSGKASKFTRSRLPVKLIFLEKLNSKSSAMKREVEIKKFSKKEKEQLIANPENQFHTMLNELELNQKAGKKKPVLSYKVFRWIFRNIPSEERVLELGSGRSSQILSKIYVVDSIEHDKRFAFKHEKVNYIFAPITFYENYCWYDKKIIEQKLANNYSLIIVDGPTSKTGREGFALNFSLFSKFNCPILIDEIDRKHEAKMLDCFIQSGFNLIHKGKDFAIIKGKKVNAKKLIENENLLICAFEKIKRPEWLFPKRNYDVCLIHKGTDVKQGQALKYLADYFISEKGTAEHCIGTAFKEIPKLNFYKKILLIDDSENYPPEKIEQFFNKA